jgi:hypothetical protein
MSTVPWFQHPPLPLEVDDKFISPALITAHPTQTMTLGHAFNARAKIYLSYAELEREEPIIEITGRINHKGTDCPVVECMRSLLELEKSIYHGTVSSPGPLYRSMPYAEHWDERYASSWDTVADLLSRTKSYIMTKYWPVCECRTPKLMSDANP